MISILCGLYCIYIANDKYYKTIIIFIAILFDDKYLANLYFYLFNLKTIHYYIIFFIIFLINFLIFLAIYKN